MPEDAVPDSPNGLHATVGQDFPETIFRAGNRLSYVGLEHVSIVVIGEAGVKQLADLVQAGDPCCAPSIG